LLHRYGCNTSNIGATSIVAGAGNSYFDFKFDSPDVRSYCYNISVLVNAGANGAFTITSTTKCETLLDNECASHPDEGYCTGKDYISCQGGKKASTENCKCGCVDKTETAPAGCVGDSKYCNVCDICSGPFGMFGYTPKSKGYDLSKLEDYTLASTCSDLLVQAFCYTDDYSKNKALIGQYHSCFDVSSCYNYRTKTSCTTNPCGITTLSDCSWISLSTNNELGLGVCIPTNEEDQDCTKCSELNILGNYCSPSMCSLYGRDAAGESTCFYNKIDSNYRNLKIDNSICMNIKDVACETYDSEIDCLGIDLEAFSINAAYTASLRSSGDNTYKTVSNDVFNRGKCVWNATTSKCVRNADGDPALKADCTSTNSKQKESCLLDFTNPETKLFILGIAAEEGAEYSRDEIKTLLLAPSEPVLNTYYSFSSAYPTAKYSSSPGTDRTNLMNSISALSEGAHTLSFYSEDLAHNLEFVNELTFSIIPDLSGITVTNSKVSAYDASLDTYLTNLTINIEYDESVPLDCKVSLKNEGSLSSSLGGDARRISPYLEWNYTYLRDGIYTLNVTCADNHNQKYTTSTIISIDADMSINSVNPRGATYAAGNVNIKINTNETATCYYTASGGITASGTSSTLGSPWIKYSTTGGMNHTASISESSTGIKYYYSACYFASTGKWFTGNNGDIIFYAIDAAVPNISIIDQSTGGLYNGSANNGTSVVQGLSLEIVCDDSNAALVSGKDYTFGCKTGSIKTKIYYENYAGKSYDIPAPIINSSDGGIAYLNILAPDSYVKVNLDVTGTDAGGNSVTKTYALTNLRNLSFMRPVIVICDPETKVCT
jgi:hypothetical protein